MKLPKKSHYLIVLPAAALYWVGIYWAFHVWWALTLAAICVGAAVVKRVGQSYYNRPQWLCHVVRRDLLDTVLGDGFRPPANEALLADRGIGSDFFQGQEDVVSFVANLPDARRVAHCKRFAELATDYCCVWIHARPSKFGLSNMEAHVWLERQPWSRPETVRFGQIVEYCVPRDDVNLEIALHRAHITELQGVPPKDAQTRRERAVCRLANSVPDYFLFR